MKTLSEIVREIVAGVVDAAECDYALYPRNMQPLAGQLREALAGKDISRIEVSIKTPNTDFNLTQPTASQVKS